MGALITRRKFLSTTSLAVVAPTLLRATQPTSYDTVIIGAGTAGLTAANALAQHGLKVLVLEARSRVGGRAWTDSEALGAPADLGASWLHNSDINPLVGFARQQGVTLHDSSTENVVFLRDGKPIGTFKTVMGAISGETGYLGASFKGVFWGEGDDGSLKEMLPGSGWGAVLREISAMSMAQDSDKVSFADYQSMADGDDYLPQDGVGHLVARLAQGIDIRLDHEVQEIDWSGPQCRITGDFGTVDAATCLITVPTTVLAEGQIAFKPKLPDAKQTAFENLRLGRFMKVIYRIPEIVSDVEEFHVDFKKMEAGKDTVIHVNPYSPTVTAFYSGSNKDAADALSSAELDAFSREVIKAKLGSEFAEKLGEFISYDWDSDPWAGGSYSVVKVGATTARRDYSQPVGETLFFAGEASDNSMATTVGGAFVAAQEQVDAILARLQKFR